MPDLAHARSNRIIELGLRDHVITNESIHRRVLPEVAAATAQKIISKLIKRGLLKRWPLHGSRSYLRLGSSAIARWQYPASYSRRLGPQVLPYLMGCLSLTTYGTSPPVRLLPCELEQAFPEFPTTRDVQQWAYYQELSESETKLATIRVEFRVGGDVVVNKIAEQLHRLRNHPTLNQVLDSNRMIVHVVTATAEQEEAIWNSVSRIPLPAEIRTCHDPRLTCFL